MVTRSIILAVVLTVAWGCSQHRASVPADSGALIVARVNGEAVELREFERQLAVQRATVARDFQARHEVADGAFSWNTTYGGERPIDELRKRALATIIERKVQEIVMKRNGVLPDITYTAFLARWNAENETRESAQRRGERIYGPAHLSEDDYAAYEFSNALTRTKEVLATGELTPSTDALLRFYDQNKDRLFTRATVYQVSVFALACEADNGTGRAEYLHEARARAARGEDLATIAQGHAGASVSEQTVLLDPLHQLHRTTFEKATMPLTPTQVSDVFSYGHSDVFVRCNRRDAEYLPLSEARGYVVARYVDQQYDSLVQELVKTATIDLSSDVYNRSQPTGESTQ